MASKRPNVSTVIKTVREGAKGVDVAGLAAQLMQSFGGPAAFSSLYKREFEDCKTATGRAKMLDGILRIVGQASARDKKPRDASQMTEEDLIATIQQVFGARSSNDAERDDEDATQEPPEQPDGTA